MTDRDHFAAAALTGLVNTHAVYHKEPPGLATMAFAMADAMLRERERTSVGVAGMDPVADRKSVATPGACASHCSQPFDSAPTTHDAAQEARAGTPGTVDTQDSFAAYARFAGTVMNWISEATGFLHDDVLRTDDARDIITDACSRCWDAFDRIAYPTDHGASPEARAESDEDRTDKAATSHRRDGTGDTPATHATRGEGSVRREGTEPAAWATFYPNGSTASVYVGRQPQHAEPLYRHPPCQDFSQKNLTLTDAERSLLEMLADHPVTHEIMPNEVATLRGLLERTGGGK